MVHTKAEGVGGSSLHKREKKEKAGFFIINCQSFAKIKASLRLHKGRKPTVAIQLPFCWSFIKET